MKGEHVEVGLVVIAGCYFIFFAHILHMFWGNLLRTYFGLGIVGVRGWVWGVWIWVGWMGKAWWESGWDGMMEWEKGREGKEECYLGSVCSLTHSISLSIDYSR